MYSVLVRGDNLYSAFFRGVDVYGTVLWSDKKYNDSYIACKDFTK